MHHVHFVIFSSEIMSKIEYLKCAVAIFKKIFFPPGKYKISICSFLEYCYTIVYMHDISCLSKGYLVLDRNMSKTVLALDLTISCIESFTCNKTTFLAFFLKKISMKQLLIYTPSLTAFKI